MAKVREKNTSYISTLKRQQEILDNLEMMEKVEARDVGLHIIHNL